MSYYEAIEIMENPHHHSMLRIKEASKVIDEMIKKAEKFDEIFHNYFEASKDEYNELIKCQQKLKVIKTQISLLNDY